MKHLPALLALIICALFLSTIPALAQSRYVATTGDVSLSGATTAFTIQQPAANGAQVQLITAVIYCSVACDITQAQNGTAATATTGTATAIMPIGPAARATVWTASNVGGGTSIGGLLHLSAGERITLDLSSISLGNGGTGTNYTIAVSSITGTANIALFWSER